MIPQNAPVPDPTPPEPLINLTKISHPVLSALMPVMGGLLKRFLKVDAINATHEKVATTAVSDTFFSRTLEVMGVRYEVSDSDLERIPETGPVVVVSNHPLGGLDGVILGDLLRRRRKDVKIMANYALSKIRYAGDHMIFVDPFVSGKPKERNIRPLRESLKHLKAGGCLAIFPGNKVSHFQWKRREIADPDWAPHVAALIRRSGASVAPIFLRARNSTFFNFAGAIHPMIRTALLPREFIRQGRVGKPVMAYVGAMIPHARLKKIETDEEMIGFLRLNTYFLANRPDATTTKEPALSEFEEKAKHAEPIAAPLAVELLEADIRALPPDACLLRQGDFEIYIGTWHQLPNIMQEIGRGRETSFREAGGGALTALDLAPQDEYYRHLFLWNTKDRAVAGAYRLGLADEIIPRHGPGGLICSTLFHFKPSFVKKLNPGLELGRSYVLPEYQKNYSSLLLLWAGITAFIARNPRYNIIFGSVALTHGGSFAPASRTLIVECMRRLHGDRSLSVQITPEERFEAVRLCGITPHEIGDLVHDVEDVSTLVTGLEKDGRGVPILFKHYVKMNAKLLDFGMWKVHGNSVVGFMIADLTTADGKFLRRYMGADGYQKFRAFHGMNAEQPAEAGVAVA